MFARFSSPSRIGGSSGRGIPCAYGNNENETRTTLVPDSFPSVRMEPKAADTYLRLMVQWRSRSLAADRKRPAGFIIPCQPKLVSAPPNGDRWSHEQARRLSDHRAPRTRCGP